MYLTLNGLWLCWRAVWLIWPCGSSRWSGPAIVGISESGFVRISESGFWSCPPPLCNGQAPPHSCQLWMLRFPSPSPLPVCRGAHLKIKHRIKQQYISIIYKPLPFFQAHPGIRVVRIQLQNNFPNLIKNYHHFSATNKKHGKPLQPFATAPGSKRGEPLYKSWKGIKI